MIILLKGTKSGKNLENGCSFLGQETYIASKTAKMVIFAKKNIPKK